MFSKLFYIALFSMLVFSCKGPEARRPIQSHSGTFIKESAKRNKELYDKEKKFIEKTIAKDSSKTYYSSENGFWYYYNRRDTSQTKSPQVGDYVEFTYDIKDFNGNNILTKEENGVQRYKIDQSNQDLISGVREGIKLMKEGETVTFLLPSYKAYGYYGIEDKLGTNIPVQSTITLRSIEHTEN
ncbi:gliding motility-associated peptidyl-prolyl isomerase GldI [Aequorivita sp. H23M31]|uniref:Peptidyl-prolyl cis-trans isomerase n=1 Tax=Aequorivita ciconiae TaxID=2494375 RepID=A0A410G7S7_9FLAO|nr:gliding motility-associated peptidyl-prolyl isomerase GldI [Aequorivita sp. H23M31]QAA83291.1 gliding motility-associated peptidyl-prolyl isomerase GldI [Aequorivita sp. H23M31]